jgi:hypothetical protein
MALTIARTPFSVETLNGFSSPEPPGWDIAGALAAGSNAAFVRRPAVHLTYPPCLGLESQIVQGVYAAAHPVGRIGGWRPSTHLESADHAGVIAALLHLVLEEIAIPWIRVERVFAVVAVLI